MNKNFKRFVSIVISLVVLITTAFSSTISMYAATPVSLEGDTFSLWADPNGVLSQEKIDAFSTDKLATLGGIKPFKNSSNSTSLYYLFLPSNADCNNLTFYFPTGKNIKIAGRAIQSGVPTDALKDIDAGGTAKNYTINDGSDHTVVCMKSGDVGTVYVDTVSGSMKTVYSSSDHSKSESGSIMVVQPDGTVDYMGAMDKIQGRGNATWSTSGEKNPFNVKLAESTSLLGMGKAKKWVLLANAYDDSLLKNQITYDFAKYIGVKYQPTCKPVDLYINQQYYGSYQLSEKVEIKSNRIDISDAYENLEIANGTVDPATGAVIPKDLTGTVTNSVTGSGTYTIGNKKSSSSLKNPNDITGGYLYELEMSTRWAGENAGFCGYNKQCWVMKNCDYASTDMVNYSYDLLFALGSSAYNNGVVPSVATTKRYSRATANNPAPATQYQGKKWDELLDSDSAVRYYWVEELFKNLDASTSSCYFFKDSDKIDSKLYAGPVWDMDKCWGFSGSRWGKSISSTDDWYAKAVRIYAYNGVLFGETDLYVSSDTTDSARPLALVGQLATLPDFWKDAGRYWYAYVSPAIDILKGDKVDETGQLKSIAEYAQTILKSGKMNAARFAGANSSNGSYNNQTNTLKNWISGRQTWITSQFTQTSIKNATVDTIHAQSYTGAEIKPEINITGTVNNVSYKLEEGTDYTVEYSNNINAGTATVKINGIGMFNDSTTAAFTINPADLSEGSTATIDAYNYADNTLSVDLKNEAGTKFEGSLSYEWYRNGEKIDGENGKVYTVTSGDVGANITAKVIGDGQNVIGEVISNQCEIREGERPVGFTKTIAAWNYDFTNNEAGLVNADETGLTNIYTATSGENQTTSTLSASVDASTQAKLKWSGTDLYVNGEITDQAPIMGTSKTDLRAWGEYPYFETTVSTLGFENIGFSAKLGGSKKGPKTWKVQYSTDGNEYYDVDGASYSISANKTLEQAFDNIVLPSSCNNQSELHIRIVVSENLAINNLDAIVGSLSGDAAINDIVVTGASTGVVTSLNAPTFDVEKEKVFDDETITLTDNNGGADMFYTINDGEEQQYTAEGFKLFDANTAKIGDTVTVSAKAKFDEIESSATVKTYTFAGVDINKFSYDKYSTDVTNGKVASSGGVYGNSGAMTATTDGNSQYVPLWNDGNGSFVISPDDGALWSENSGFTYCVSTAGFENITFTADAYTTGMGPKSVSLQYSTNGVEFTTVAENVSLASNGALENTFAGVQLPAECNHQSVVYIRLATTENSTFGGDKLHNNVSKGNLYVNNVVVAGEANGKHKMPYTNKSTEFFGANGTIKYYSPDNKPVKYIVTTNSGEVVQEGIASVDGIKLADSVGFYPYENKAYNVITWVGDAENDDNVKNLKTYYFKGETITKFDFTSTKRPITNYTTDFMTLSNTSGKYEGSLSMMPNGQDKATLSYSDSYGVKVAWSETNPFYTTKKLDSPKNNGYWLIETSTLGYTNLTLSLNQISSNKGPRDWGVAYSTDGNNYTYVANSNVRAISNDASIEPVQTYSNLVLPTACGNQEKLYIKVFINGGESVDGAELETLLKGNTGINSIELNGIKTPVDVEFTVSTVVQDAEEISVDATVRVNNTEYKTENGSVTITAQEGRTVDIKASMNGKSYFTDTQTVTVSQGQNYTIPVFALDPVGDGVFNAKDYAFINNNFKGDDKTKLLEMFNDYYQNAEI